MTAPHTGPLTVLVANRGEIAVRIMRTLQRLGVGTVAVHSDADADAPHVRMADTAVRVGAAPLAESYLDSAAIIAAARATGATMVHPGYGFLAENAEFARDCARAGLTFIGPPPEAIATMGDKISAKRAVAAAGVPLLPGFAEPPGEGMSLAELREAAADVGFPLLIKPSAGGGGKGMRLVRDQTELADAVTAARREAESAFGDATLLLERLLTRPRHVEIQVLADGHGTTVHLGERECSLQRRHQKIVEEAPSPLLTEGTREAMGASAVAAARACGYVGAGTVEFIVERARDVGDTPSYSFLEMNTRLQVEHPVTEAVATVRGQRGLDLVELQLRIALGEALPFRQDDVSLTGHAVEARVYAEDADRDFLPTGGPVLLLDEPDGQDVRVDSGISAGAEITSAYDPMLGKVVAWAPERTSALRRLDAALAGYTLLGCVTNVAFLRRLLRHPEVVAGDLSTDMVERVREEIPLETRDGVPEEVYVAAALEHQLALEPTGPVVDRFDIPDGWRLTTPAWTPWRLRAPGHDPVTVAVRPDPASQSRDRFEVSVDGATPVTAGAVRGERELGVTHAGRSGRYLRAVDGDTLWLGAAGNAWCLRVEEPLTRSEEADGTGDSVLRSPMPGTVLAVRATEGQRVTVGTPVVVIEAMKMEHTVTATTEGTVTRLRVHTGQTVTMDAPLAVVGPSDGDPADRPLSHKE